MIIRTWMDVRTLTYVRGRTYVCGRIYTHTHTVSELYTAAARHKKSPTRVVRGQERRTARGARRALGAEVAHHDAEPVERAEENSVVEVLLKVAPGRRFAEPH